MAKDFKKVNTAFKSAKAAESILAKMDEIKNIDVNLIDVYEDNNEDVSNIDDLLVSMKENGFTDPIEVTNYGCKDGRFIILSGHRRYNAWTTLHDFKQPIKCIVVSASKFKCDEDVKNYVLLANSQRDSAKDPLLLVKRYQEHEKYLLSINFKGSKREEIAKRLGISVKQADRYKAVNKCIKPIQDLIKKETIGLSSAVYLAPFSDDEQKEILEMLEEVKDKENGIITRTMTEQVTKSYKEKLNSSKDEISKVTCNEEKEKIATEQEGPEAKSNIKDKYINERKIADKLNEIETILLDAIIEDEDKKNIVSITKKVMKNLQANIIDVYEKE